MDSNTVNVHVYGKFYTEGIVGVANNTPTHTLCVGSNVFFEDTGSNVMFANGNVFIQQLNLGDGGLVSTNDLFQIDGSSLTPVVFGSNVQMKALRTDGTFPSGVSNLLPIDDFSVGDKVFANLTSGNVLTVVGNTVTTNLQTQSLFSASNVTVHADHSGGDSTSNALVLKSGPTVSNVSSIEIFGASTSVTNQNIRFKTKNTERLRITSTGKIGIANTNPSEALTISGNVHVTGSNAVVYGNTWGSKGMRMYSEPNVGENKIENIVAVGKGLNFYASQTSTMGAPKMTILETSNVGIGTTQPQSLFQTSGGSAFINQQVTRRNNYNHLSTPLVVTNTAETTVVNQTSNVFQLTKEGTGSKYGARASFKLGKWDMTDNRSKTRLDINLANDDYAVDTNIMTIRSDGKVGIGHGEPEAFLEVKCEGVGSPGLLVHNHDNGDAIISAKTDLNDGNAFSSYVNGNGGWAVGIAGAQGDFRITKNAIEVSDSATVGLYISGANGNVGLGTDSPRGALDVLGNVVIGNQLTFGGLAGDEFGNTLVIERKYGTAFNQTELILYKGNEGSSFDAGPDRIRHLAAEHIFQTYTGQPTSFYGEALPDAGPGEAGNVPLCIIGKNGGTVVIGGQRSTADSISDNTKLVVNGDIEFGSGGAFRLTGFAFSTTEAVVGATSNNLIRSLLDGSARRPIRFLHEIDDTDSFEFARFSEEGYLGLGTAVPSANVHIYSEETTDINVLKLESPGTNKETGMLIYTGDGEGGYLKGFSNSENGTTGLIVGVANNSTLTNCIHVIHSSNVGIGTDSPGEKFHVYDGMVRVESVSSNATIELTTTAGSANIYADTTGNVYINPSLTGHRNHIFLNSNVEVIGDFSVDGALDLGNQVAIGLDGATANTALHVNGGIITNSDQVSTKKYSNTFPINFGNGQDIQLTFRPGTFYAKVVAVLRETSDVRNTSTMILELSGGTHDGTTASMYDIAIGTKNLFGTTNAYPWSATATAGTRSIDIRPVAKDSTQNYNYDISVEVTSACDGGLAKISHKIFSFPADLDNGVGGQLTLATFTY